MEPHGTVKATQINPTTHTFTKTNALCNPLPPPHRNTSGTMHATYYVFKLANVALGDVEFFLPTELKSCGVKCQFGLRVRAEIGVKNTFIELQFLKHFQLCKTIEEEIERERGVGELQRKTFQTGRKNSGQWSWLSEQYVAGARCGSVSAHW